MGAFATALASYELKQIPALPGRTNHLEAGILVPMMGCEGREPRVVATVRASTMREHAGEVCFPGGRAETGDDSLMATALREAEEELGIDDVDVLGPLSSVPLFTSDYRVFPFVGVLADGGNLVASPDEVDEVIHFDILEVLAQAHLDALAWSFRGLRGLSPIFTHGDHVMYGATAHVFHELLALAAPLLDRELPPLRECALTWADVLPEGFVHPEG